MSHTPIEDYGVIGDLATVALVSTSASIDFCCLPRFDSPTVFAALLDPERGGSFSIEPALDGARRKQLYLPDTNILVTRFLAADGLAEIDDLMPIGASGGRRALIRRVRSVRGTIRYRLRCAPRFDYARLGHRLAIEGPHAIFRPDGNRALPLRLCGPHPLSDENGDAVASFELHPGESAAFALTVGTESGDFPEILPEEVPDLFRDTANFWRGWVGRSRYQGRWREMVHRSALVLKLLSSAEFGSIVAAPTFGLPEAIGGERNWDYRYTWVRDAAFTLYALMRLGYTEEAEAFIHWLDRRCLRNQTDGTLQIMYGIDGSRELTEEELPHLAGYCGSRPVRIGNAAYSQLQLDIYGELMDAVYLANKYGGPISYDSWVGLTQTVDWVCANWRQPDEGIWELRSGRREFLHSRLMCWVAIDRAIRLANKRSLPAPLAKWVETRSEIHHDIFTSFWDEEQRAFVQYKGGKALDAACLLMPLVKFVSPTDPRWLSTLDAIGSRLAEDALVRRYDLREAEDGLAGTEGSFTACSFWYVECLARAGRVEEAQLLFEKMLGYANHLGLFAEELGESGEHLGNFPQALTHLALISAAYALDRELTAAPHRPWAR